MLNDNASPVVLDITFGKKFGEWYAYPRRQDEDEIGQGERESVPREQCRKLKVEGDAVRFDAFDVCPCHEQKYRDPKQREEALDSTPRPKSRQLRCQSACLVAPEKKTTDPKLVGTRRRIIRIEVTRTRSESDCSPKFLC